MEHRAPKGWKNRRRKKRPPEELYRILCEIFPESVAAECFEKTMGYAPDKKWEGEQKHELEGL